MPVTTGVTTASVSPVGFIGGGQIGCDYQFAPTWVVGIEGAASGSTLKGSTTVGLPLGLPGETASVSGAMDLLPSVTARLGYAADRWLFYVKGGAALASDSYSVTGTFTGTPFDFEGLDLRYGWTVGGGVEWAFTDIWSARTRIRLLSVWQRQRADVRLNQRAVRSCQRQAKRSDRQSGTKFSCVVGPVDRLKVRKKCQRDQVFDAPRLDRLTKDVGAASWRSSVYNCRCPWQSWPLLSPRQPGRRTRTRRFRSKPLKQR